ncbi:hypothetical protein BH10CYA1_BH10CYA1_64480 [soil metagenome]
MGTSLDYFRIGNAFDANLRCNGSRNIWYQTDHQRNLSMKLHKAKKSMAKIIEKYSQWAFSSGATDRPAAETLIRKCYRNAGLAEPRKFLWFSSPPDAVRAAALVVHLLDRECLDTFDKRQLNPYYSYRRFENELSERFLLSHFKSQLQVRSAQEDCERLAAELYLHHMADYDIAFFDLRITLERYLLDEIRSDLTDKAGADKWNTALLHLASQLEDTEYATLMRGGSQAADFIQESLDVFLLLVERTVHGLIGSAARGPNDAFVCCLYECLEHVKMPVDVPRMKAMSECLVSGVWFWPLRDLCLGA